MIVYTDVIESFEDLQARCHGRAADTLDAVYCDGKEWELMDLLEEYFSGSEDGFKSINNFLCDSHMVCESLGIEIEH